MTTPRARAWVRNGRPARILHLFDEVCNLVNDRDEIISLVSPQVGIGPFAVVLDGDFTADLDLERPVAVDAARQGLTVGSLVVDVGRTAVWSSCPNWKQLQGQVWSDGATLAADIEAYLRQLLLGIVNGNEADCRAGAYGLAGRGGGLTPTGDDVLMGVLYGLWVWQMPLKWMEMIVETAVSRTTTLSANFLTAAAAGEATYHWHDLVNGSAAANVAAADVAAAVVQIQAIGHTSGVDAWAGFVRANVALSTICHELHEYHELKSSNFV
ncbi:MAG: DUF2877 domain-containing protein [Chloroflexi bacterium]|nr:DUF2877 domain-containing protein [Chloroflexota bacterium]